MKKFDGILICTDLDGTLLNNDHTVSKENLEAIEYFKSEGGKFTLVTGRMPYCSRSIKDVINPNAPVGCVNGGGIYDYETEKYVELLTLPDNVTEVVIDVAEAVEGIGVVVNTPDKLYFPYDNAATERHRSRTKMPYESCELRNFNTTIAKIVFADMREDAIEKIADILNNHKRKDEFSFIRSERTLYEILPLGINKGRILPKLCEFLGIDIKRTVAVGDYNNDVAMLKAAGVGIAVANAVEEVKAVADYVTVSNEENAIAKIIYDIEKGEIKL